MTYQYVPARTNHILHFVLSCMTVGLWVPVWMFATIRNHNRSVTKRLPVAPTKPAWMQPQGVYPTYPPPSPLSPGLRGDEPYGSRRV